MGADIHTFTTHRAASIVAV